jgi:hypothetical protein
MTTERWEYNVLELSYAEWHSNELNEIGRGGWELVTIVYRPSEWPLAYFKRCAAPEQETRR